MTFAEIEAALVRGEKLKVRYARVPTDVFEVVHARYLGARKANVVLIRNTVHEHEHTVYPSELYPYVEAKTLDATTPDDTEDFTETLRDIDNTDMLHQLRALVGAALRNDGAIATSDVLSIAQAFNALDKRLTIGEVLPRAWQRCAIITLQGR